MEAAFNSTITLFEQLKFAREVLRVEGQAVLALADRLGPEFCDAAALFLTCRGNIVVTGMGKAGLIGQKIAATMSSTGTSAHFLHPSEAVHGDLGRVHSDDAMLVLSYSGETEEILRLLPSLRGLKIPVVAITGRPQSALGNAANVVIDLGPMGEACALGLAPSTSTTAMLAVGDALALLLSRLRGFGRDDFARFHPAGTLGRKLSRVEDLMRPLSECRVADESRSVREVFIQCSRPGRRSGAIMLVDHRGAFSGIFTDSDLARLLEVRRDSALDLPICDVMTRSPQHVFEGARISDALDILARRRISELPVLNQDLRPLGLLDITDIIGMLPRESAGSAPDLSTLDVSESVPYVNQT